MAQALERGEHGEWAYKPEEIPRQGWIRILRRVYSSLSQKNLSILAAGVAFFAMLSIFPVLAALVALYGLIADPLTVQRQVSAISSAMARIGHVD